MKERKGFTLVELAIVLVIIGLLLGAVLKGQELIKNAKIKRAISQAKEIEAAVYTYYDKYNAFPGDDPNAADRWGNSTTSSGNGDGWISGGYCTSEGEESCLLWQHLRLANIINGDSSGNGPSYLPRSVFGGPIDVFSYTYDNKTSLWVTFRNVPGDFAEQLDLKLDDGKPDSGSVIAYNTSDTSYNAGKHYDIWISF
ncbi:type II secretion system protein [Desulfurobacterium thermolithotrophum]|uniref:type II secretion system protein n=1 Tax=Desulfurobacterium thermolithotrophum TaxID=64160 RepID=UPI0013D70BF7|nr:type II secretion system protein [Desulfurobacterium thermolithotrophum]